MNSIIYICTVNTNNVEFTFIPLPTRYCGGFLNVNQPVKSVDNGNVPAFIQTEETIYFFYVLFETVPFIRIFWYDPNAYHSTTEVVTYLCITLYFIIFVNFSYVTENFLNVSHFVNFFFDLGLLLIINIKWGDVQYFTNIIFNCNFFDFGVLGETTL